MSQQPGVVRPAASRQARPWVIFLRTVGRRLGWAIPALLVVTFLLYLLLGLSSYDPAATVAGGNATPENLKQIRHELGLDKPILARYWSWLTSALHGDLGHSIVTRKSVMGSLLDALPATLSLVFVGLFFASLFGLILGSLPGVFPNRWMNRTVSTFTSLTYSVPSFWAALLLTTYFAIDLRWFPALGFVSLSANPWEWFRHLVLPATALALSSVGALGRQLHSQLQEVLQNDYIMAARSKGLSTFSRVIKHGVRNAALPVLTVLGTRVTVLIGGTIIIEQMFLIDGIGRLAVTATLSGDIPVVLGVVVFATIVVAVVNAVVDALYAWIDPRLRTA